MTQLRGGFGTMPHQHNGSVSIPKEIDELLLQRKRKKALHYAISRFFKCFECFVDIPGYEQRKHAPSPVVITLHECLGFMFQRICHYCPHGERYPDKMLPTIKKALKIIRDARKYARADDEGAVVTHTPTGKCP